MLGYTNRRQLRMLFHYMLQYGNTAEPGVFLRRLARRLPQYEETLMSIAQKLKQEVGNKADWKAGKKGTGGLAGRQPTRGAAHCRQYVTEWPRQRDGTEDHRTVG